MTMHWLIDSELFPAYRDELIAAIGRAGHTAVPFRSPAPPYHRLLEIGGFSFSDLYATDKDAVVAAVSAAALGAWEAAKA